MDVSLTTDPQIRFAKHLKNCWTSLSMIKEVAKKKVLDIIRINKKPTLETYLDLTKIEEINTWWYMIKTALRIKEYRGKRQYTEESLELCLQGMQKNRRFQGIHYATSQQENQGKDQNELWDLKRSPEKDFSFDPSKFPQLNITSYIATMEYFSDMVTQILCNAEENQDKKQAMFDKLSFLIIRKILESIYFSEEPNDCNTIRVPSKIINDKENVQFSLSSLKRANQFYSYFCNKKKSEFSQDETNYLQNEVANIVQIREIFRMFIYEPVHSRSTGGVSKANSSTHVHTDEPKRKKMKCEPNFHKETVLSISLIKESDQEISDKKMPSLHPNNQSAASKTVPHMEYTYNTQQRKPSPANETISQNTSEDTSFKYGIQTNKLSSDTETVLQNTGEDVRCNIHPRNPTPANEQNSQNTLEVTDSKYNTETNRLSSVTRTVLQNTSKDVKYSIQLGSLTSIDGPEFLQCQRMCYDTKPIPKSEQFNTPADIRSSNNSNLRLNETLPIIRIKTETVETLTEADQRTCFE